MNYVDDDFKKSCNSFMADDADKNFKWVRENPVQTSQLLWRAIGIIQRNKLLEE